MPRRASFPTSFSISLTRKNLFFGFHFILMRVQTSLRYSSKILTVISFVLMTRLRIIWQGPTISLFHFSKERRNCQTSVCGHTQTTLIDSMIAASNLRIYSFETAAPMMSSMYISTNVGDKVISWFRTPWLSLHLAALTKFIA